jgi:hypothetical protein
MSPRVLAVSLLILALHASSALAQLGGGPGSVDVVRATFNATERGTLHAGSGPGAYTIRRLELRHSTLREYVSDLTGDVFAVAWSGAALPRLEVLLGGYSDELTQAMAGSKLSRVRSPHVSYRTENLTVDRVGRPGVAAGRVCVSAKLPEGVSCAQLR